MKIDLHVHTKKIDKGETVKRNIPSINFFIDTLLDNNVGIVAITNHDTFDKEQYFQILAELTNKKYERNKLLIFPGVELKVYLEDQKYKHVNLIISNNDNIDDFLLDIKEYLKSDKKIDDLNIFKNKKIILYIDTKRGDTGWSDIEINELLKNWINKNPRKYSFICDVNNKFSLLRYRARNFNTLIGSDLQDWQKYNELASKLIDINIEIDSFESFFNTLAYDDQKTFDNLFNNLKTKFHIDNFYINIENDKKINIGNVDIYEGVNIIFGPKATGKTKMLQFIYNNNKDKSVFYSADDKEKIINKFWENSEKNHQFNQMINDKKKELLCIINEIKNYKEISFCKWNDLFNSFHKNEIKILSYFKIQNVTKPDIKNLKYSLILSKKLIKSLENIKKNIYSKSKYYIENLRELILLLKKEIYCKMKNYWKMNLYKKIHNKMNNVKIMNNGKRLSISSISLFDRWNNRYKLKTNIDNLKNEKWNVEWIDNNQINIDERGKIKLKIIAETIKFNNIEEYIKNESNHLVKNNKEKLKKLNKLLKVDCFKINNLINDRDIKEILDKIINEPYKNKHVYEDEKNNHITLSNGEKSLLALDLIFNENKDFYLLDEPDSYLNVKNIFDILIDKIWKKSNENKKIIITTHNPILAINTIPFNLIYRDKNDNNSEYFTFVGNPWTKKFKDIKNELNQKDFIETLIKQFECDKKHFDFRKDVYYDSE